MIVFTKLIKKSILSSTYWRYIISQLPGGLLAQKLSGKYILYDGIIMTSILSALGAIAFGAIGINMFSKFGVLCAGIKVKFTLIRVMPMT